MTSFRHRLASTEGAGTIRTNQQLNDPSWPFSIAPYGRSFDPAFLRAVGGGGRAFPPFSSRSWFSISCELSGVWHVACDRAMLLLLARRALGASSVSNCPGGGQRNWPRPLRRLHFLLCESALRASIAWVRRWIYGRALGGGRCGLNPQNLRAVMNAALQWCAHFAFFSQVIVDMFGAGAAGAGEVKCRKNGLAHR